MAEEDKLVLVLWNQNPVCGKVFQSLDMQNILKVSVLSFF